MYTYRRKLLSQNFLCNRQLVGSLVRSSSLSSNDIVLEIGPGQGIITQELVNIVSKVIAVEIDSTLLSSLKSKFSDYKNLQLIQGDFLNQPLPTSRYKVFANLPFRITSNILRKLLFSSNPPDDCYLIVQKETANKFITNTYRNSLVSIIHHPWFESSIIHNFQKTDFYPIPSVEPVMLRIKSRALPLVPIDQKENFYDYVAYQFNRNKSAKFITTKDWIIRFNQAKSQSRHRGSFKRLQSLQSKLPKIHRTRTDKNWKRYNSNQASSR